MQKINLGNGLFALIDNNDYDLISKYSWHITTGNYAATSYNNTTLHMHVLIMNPPEDKVVDHRDGHRLDNRKHNLRICSQAQNTRNRRKHNKSSSEFIGIHWNNSKNKWITNISYNYNKILLGWFDDEEKAARAYNIGAELLNLQFNEKYPYNKLTKYLDDMVLTPHNYKKLCDFCNYPYDTDKYGYVFTKNKYLKIKK